ncbi:MAG TPA: PA14 domain-containing protein [Solirubrobacteraceae bacterium]
MASSAAVAAPPVGLQPGDQEVNEEAAREQAARANGASAVERNRRLESRTAFRGLTRAGALDLLKSRHPERVLLPAWRGPQLPPGHQIAEYEGDFAARLIAPDGATNQLVTSTVPMRASDDAGRKRPVDLALTRVGREFRSVNPLADIRLADDLAEGLRISDMGLVVTPVGAGGHAEPVVSGDTVFYAEAMTDTDIVVRPTVGGFEIDLQVRSVASPEHFELNLDAAADYELARLPDGSGIQVRHGDDIIGVVTAPVAWDADHRPVELEWTLSGGRLTIDMAHRERDLAYPLLVDPEAITYFNWERRGEGDAMRDRYDAWQYLGYGNFAGLSWAGQSTWLGNGLYIRNLSWGTTGYLFSAGDSGAWNFRAPGHSRISQVEWNLVDQDYVDGTRLELGVARQPISGAPGGWYGTPIMRTDLFYGAYFQTCSSTCAPGTGEAGDTATFKLVATSTANRPYFAAQVGVAYVHVYEDDRPQVASALPKSWVNWPTSTRLPIWAFDTSTGIEWLDITSTGWGSQAPANTRTIAPDWGTRCNHHALCPRMQPADRDPYSITVGSMQEGLNTMTAVAKDGVGNTSQLDPGFPEGSKGLRGTYFHQTDLRLPAVAGRLDANVDFDWSTTSPDPSMDPETWSARWMGMVYAPVTGEYKFSTNTDDGARLYVGGYKSDLTTPADFNVPIIDKWKDQSPTSYDGVQTRHLIGGGWYRIVMEYYDQSGGAKAQLKWSYPGQATPVVIPTDRLQPPRPWQLKLDRGSPTFDMPTGVLYDKRGKALDGPSSVRVTARDGNPAGPNPNRRSGVRRMEAYLAYGSEALPGVLVGSKDQAADCPVDPAQPSGARSTDSCPMYLDYTFPNNDPTYLDGKYTITFKAFDFAGNPVSQTTWSFIKDSLPPQITNVAHTPALPTGWVKSQSRRVTVDAVDIGTGVLGMTLTKPRPSGNFNDTKTNNCLGTIASICDNPDQQFFDYTTDELIEGYADLSVKAFDSAQRNSAASTFRLKIDRSGPVLATPTGSLWDSRNRTDDHRREGLYDATYTVQLSATDGGNLYTTNRRSGTKAINVKVKRPNGTVALDSPDPSPQSCAAESCPKPRTYTLNTDSLPDGEYTIEVTAVDQLDNASEPTTWPVTVDRRGDVYQAEAWTAKPADGGESLGEEWVQTAAPRARVQRLDHRATLSPVTCNPDAAGCLQRRIRTIRADSDPSAADTYVTTTGTSAGDERLLGESDLLEASRGDNGDPDGSGQLLDVVEPWQVPPPAHGSTYELYEEVEPATVDDQDVDLITRLYVDVATKLPVRSVDVVDEVVVGTIYYTYAPRRLESSEVAEDFFALSRPAFVSYESSDQLPPDTGGTEGEAPARTVTPAERLDRAMGVRRQFGFPASAAYVQTLLADPTRDATIDSWSAPMTDAENLELTRRADVTFARDEIDAYTGNQATYSGSYLSQSDGKLHVGFTGAVATHLNALDDIFPYPDRLVVESMAYTRAELATLRNEVSDDWRAGELDAYAIASLGIDEKRNRVVIGINPLTEAHRSALISRYGGRVAVERDHTEEVKRRKPVRGGEQISRNDGTRCTAGFTVTGTAIQNNKRKRQHFKLTAGHCAGVDPDGDADYAYGTRWLSPRGPMMGHWGMTAYPDDGDKLDADAGYITLRNGFATSLIVLDRKGERRRYAKVAGQKNARRGDTYCWHGAHTNLTTCGEVTGTEYERPAEGDRTITDQVEVSVDHKCAALEGDSGAPTWLPTGERGEVYASGILGARTGLVAGDILNDPPPCDGEADYRGIAATPLTRAFKHLNSAGNPLTVLISEGT